MNNLTISASHHSESIRYIELIGGVLVVFIAACVYQPIVNLSFCLADDPWMLLSNPYVTKEKFSLEFLYGVFTRINDIQYSPINTIFYNLVYKINGFDPYYFHLANFIIHLLNGYMINKVSKKVLYCFNVDNHSIIAFFISFVWIIHPLNVETVVWVSGSKILLCTFLTLISLNCFIDVIQKGGLKKYIFCFAAFIASCFCKEQGIITPFMFLLFVLLYNRFSGVKTRPNSSSLIFVYIGLLFSIGFGIFSLYVNEFAKTNFTPISAYPLYQRIILCFYCIRFYLINFFTPINLHYHYEFPVKPNDDMPITFYLFPLFFIPFIALLLVYVKKSKNALFLFFCLGIFILQLSLELQIIPMTRPAIVADRYMYLPSLGLLLIAVAFIVNKIFLNFKSRKLQTLSVAVFLIYIAFITAYSHQLVENWAIYNLIK